MARSAKKPVPKKKSAARVPAVQKPAPGKKSVPFTEAPAAFTRVFYEHLLPADSPRTSHTCAPVASHIADMLHMCMLVRFSCVWYLFIEEIRWARNAFAANFDSSDDHTLVVIILSAGTQ